MLIDIKFEKKNLITKASGHQTKNITVQILRIRKCEKNIQDFHKLLTSNRKKTQSKLLKSQPKFFFSISRFQVNLYENLICFFSVRVNL